MYTSSEAVVHQKAFEINLDPSFYGTFAEIGAGQEVARNFFRVGAAAGTVAKTMSAYDMKLSDSIYGETKVYVSRFRLRDMLEVEYKLLSDRLDSERGNDTRFFVLANTVAAKGYKTSHDCHGWMGVRMQCYPRGPVNDILLHMRMLDDNTLDQQEAIGILGVNLMHLAFHYKDLPNSIYEGLMHGLDRNRIEIDVVLLEGPDFEHIDNRLINLNLVDKNLSNAVIFAPGGVVRHASEMFYKRPLLLERGRFRPVTNINLKMMECAHEAFLKDTGHDPEKLLEVMEISTYNLLSDTDGSPYDANFMAGMDILDKLGKTVLVSNYGEFHRLFEYLRQYSKSEVGLVVGVALLAELFKEKYYTNLVGGILEATGRLFKDNMLLYVYPAVEKATGELHTAENLKVEHHLRLLYRHLIENGRIRSLQTERPKPSTLTASGLAERIAINDPGWEDRVTPEVCQMIKENGYFGWKETAGV